MSVIATYILEDVKKIAVAFDGIAQFRSDTYVSFSKKGIHVSTIDKQHVMFIDLAYSTCDMLDATYNVSEDAIRMHFDMKALASTLKLAVKRGNVTLSLEKHGDDRTLKVSLEGSEFVVHEAPHDTRLADSELEPVRDAPDMELTLTCKEAKRIFKELLSFNSDIRITCSQEKQTAVLGCGGSTGTATMVIRDGSEGVQDLTLTRSVLQSFDCKYLQKIIKQDVGNKLITIRLRNNLPIEICHAASDHSHLAFHLAPKSCS